MSVPVTGKYVSADKQFSILIESANATNGQIQGSYNASWSPIGVFQTDGNVGTYGWVFSKSANRDGVAPFSIAFSASVRPEPGRPYVLQDHWIGGYQTNNTLLLTGSRSFVNSDGVVESISLGTQTFSL